MNVNIPSFGVTSRACPTNTVKRNGSVEDIKFMFPYFFPSLDMKTSNVFLLGDILSCSTKNIHVVTNDNRCRATYKVSLPKQVFSIFRPFRNQVFFQRHTILTWSPPMRPIIGNTEVYKHKKEAK